MSDSADQVPADPCLASAISPENTRAGQGDPAPDAESLAAKSRSGPGRWRSAVAVLTSATALAVVLLYVLNAWSLANYPWDWSPEEGVQLDWARRVLEDPGSLYSRTLVPFPSAYGPLLPILQAPLVRLEQPLMAVRLLALASTLLGAIAIWVLVHRRAGFAWGAAAVALYLVPFNLTFWHMMVRVDGTMITLWLWAAVFLLPREPTSGHVSLTRGRMAGGVVLLLAAILVKPTALLLGAPLVLSWFFVDRRLALRLAAVLGIAGLATLALLQALTDGAYLWVVGLWRLHPRHPGLVTSILSEFLNFTWPHLTLAMAAFLCACLLRARPLREFAIWLLLGGLAVTPTLGKYGAWCNYLLPLFAAIIVVSASWFSAVGGALSRERPRATPIMRWAPLGATLLALALAVSRPFPLPSTSDESTARTFYGFTQEFHTRFGGPFLVSRPDLVYFLVGQPAEIEGSGFRYYAAGGAQGAGDVLERLRRRHYTLVVISWPLPDGQEWEDALFDGYRHIGGCRLGWFFGSAMSHILVRNDFADLVTMPRGSRCALASPGTTPRP